MEPIDGEAACGGGRTRGRARQQAPRRRFCRKLTPEDVALFDGNSPCRPLLRTLTGAFLPTLYARTSLSDRAKRHGVPRRVVYAGRPEPHHRERDRPSPAPPPPRRQNPRCDWNLFIAVAVSCLASFPD